MKDFIENLLPMAGYALLSNDEELLTVLHRLRDAAGPLFRDWKTAKAFDLEPYLTTPEMMAAIKDLEAILDARKAREPTA